MSRNKAIWLARLLFRRGQLTKDEILDAWGRCDKNARRMAPSTFYDNRHLLEERFGIKLKCESGYYSLDLRDGKERDFMKQLFRYDDTAHDSAPAIYIDEQLPAGYRHVAAITEAMERRLWLETEYEPFDKPGYTTALAPYCLRTFRGRCYVVGLSERHNGIRTFALDRIARARITEHSFRTDSHFSAARYFANSFGAYGGMDLKAEHIVIDADTRAAAYLRTRPLHDSQREVCRADSTHRNKTAGEKRRQHTQETPLKNTYHDNNTKEEEYPYRFEMDVAISADFVRELLYYGNEIRIAQPAALQEMILEAAEKTVAVYRRH